MRKWILPIIAAAAFAFGFISVVHSQPRHETAVPPAPPPVSAYEHRVAAVGLVETSTENIAIGTPLADVVVEVPVTVGQSVKAGDVLFRLDDRQWRAELAARQADLRVTQTQVKVNQALLNDAKRQLGFAEAVTDKGAISAEELTNRRSAVETAAARLDQSNAQVESAAGQVKMTETQIERSVVRAPVDGQALQVKVHPGEFAPAGVTETPLVLLGRLHPLHVRVDVDEHEAWRVRPEAKAVAAVRGNANLKTPLTFVRFEPFVVPKKSLTGDSTERVDTRVLQVIYRIDDGTLPLFVGEQMDVFIEREDGQSAEAAHLDAARKRAG
jgi:multidrug efflux pump subunit AcrA (membrane-fusion protein)